MSARPSRTPSYRLHKPSGQAVVTLNGRDVYLGRYNTPASRARYDQVVAEWLQSGRQLTGQADLTVSELMVRYLTHVDVRYTSSEPAKIRLALRPVQELYGMTPVREFGPLALKAVRQVFVKRALVRAQVNKLTRRIVQMFRWAVAEELVDPMVHHALKAVEGLRRGRGDVRESGRSSRLPTPWWTPSSPTSLARSGR